MKKSSRLDHALPGIKLYIQMKLVENSSTPLLGRTPRRRT
jgi:hypothetical protein